MGKPTDLSARIAREARTEALKQLVENHRDEYDTLRDTWSARLKVMYGWEDGRSSSAARERKSAIVQTMPRKKDTAGEKGGQWQ